MSNINLGLGMSSLNVGLKQAAYTGVILHAGKSDSGDTKDYLAGSTSGNVLEVTVPNGTRAMAYAILDGLKKRGYRYQPFESDNTVTDPAIEIGDNVTANGITSVVFGIQLRHTALMASTLEAPFDEEVNHEWKYETRMQRQFSRESAYTRSRLAINEDSITAEVARATSEENRISSRIVVTADAITAEVQRATAAEGSLSSRIAINANDIYSEVLRAVDSEASLSSRIEQTATDITAKVSKTGGNSSSFAWTLTDSSWTLTSNNTTVLKATSAGIEVKGKITATSGYIGNGSSGFTIGNTAIYNGMTAIDDTDHDGLYLGTDGISLGKGNFTVTKAGALTAKSGYIGNGSNGFTIGNTSIRNGMTGITDTTNDGIWVGTNGIALGAGKFKVTSAGAVTAANLAMTGGSITIKDGDGNVTFKVSSTGALTATSGTFSGNVYANKIQYGGNYGTLSGSGITDNSITSGKYGNESIGGGKIITGTITGGTDGNGYPIGNIASSSVAYGNVGFTGTLDQVGTNTSNINSLYNYFNGTAYATQMNIANLYLLFNGDYCQIGGRTIKDGNGNYVAVLTF